MRGVYTAVAKISSLAAARTLMYLTAPSNKVVELLSASVTNESNATNFQGQVAIQDISSLGMGQASGEQEQLGWIVRGQTKFAEQLCVLRGSCRCSVGNAHRVRNHHGLLFQLREPRRVRIRA